MLVVKLSVKDEISKSLQCFLFCTKRGAVLNAKDFPCHVTAHMPSEYFLQVRLNFLSTLLDEAYGFLHSFLTASLLNCKLFRQSFNRDVPITAQNAASMRAELSHCQQVNLWRNL